MEHVLVKTVCGFLNAEGGSLLVGVDDSGAVLGVQPDIDSFGAKGDHDKLELRLRQLFDANLSIKTAGVVRLHIERNDLGGVVVVSVASSGKPVFAKPMEGKNDPTEFWVRVGNATKQLHGDDAVVYQGRHWG